MSEGYKHNHYVPEWYQKRFLPSGESRQYYLDLNPETVIRDGHRFTRRAQLRWGPRQCFAQDDLYTTTWGGLENRDIEKFFFGKLDNDGEAAIAHFADFTFGSASHDAFETLLPYMSVQKLRTPKGLGWLRQIAAGGRGKDDTLLLMQRIKNIFCAIWTECVWQIADASSSPTKFIISDHPVVAYNRECFPGSQHCTGFNDPDIRFAATQTFFPLSPDKILILTNLSWVRDPFQNPLKLRPNPEFFRDSVFSFLDIQLQRQLSEAEVLQINYITKKRAYRYIAAAEEEWLYPERHIKSDHWRKFGNGYLLMPDPRHIHGGGEMLIGYKSGQSDGFSEYGHKPWQQGYKDDDRERREWAAMDKFKAEWAATYGPNYRGVVHDLGKPSYSMGEEWYKKECERDKQYLKRPGERVRRRRLRP
ncbi:DUF4238 domain-containing protein [Rhizobium leguminosarum]|uniref:DUF4238 domain-containing protein n=1 Tax=Rhizobium leguminosarum TaxID=384 RepID=A0A2K9Z6V2_RHILE|nr:DUF4238 domain-containing protein [Rhizobium leguminosarum]AUW43959.1 hypothetical protein CUJ84_Chr003628 [Rhizobium leguminosarum]